MNNQIQHKIIILIQKIFKKHGYFQNESGKDSTKLESLSPKRDLSDKNYSKYAKYLTDALKNNNINNIAITGKYGSGKSSIIDSYFLNRNDYLKVNFATFAKPVKEKLDSDKSNISANIINQIIYQVVSKQVPLTKFKIKSRISNFNKFLYIAQILLCLSFFIHIKSEDFMPYLVPLTKLKSENFFWLNFGRLSLFLIIGIYILWQIFSNLELSKIKFSLKNIDTEIDLSNDDLFEKHIDEIIYLFEQSKKRILIIEDLDRFEDISIFEKLRELNIKLNYKCKHHWQFIYLVKDDLFSNAENRVKFFDLIIPVIPFITRNNSFDKLRDLFPLNYIRLMSILSAYIDDYRLLLNIKNEYKIFSEIASPENSDELLALIAYKNLYPDRFDDLQNGKGELAEIVKKYKNNIDNQIEKTNSLIDTLKKNRDCTAASNEAEYLYLWSGKGNLLYKGNHILNVENAQKIIKNNDSFMCNNHNVAYSDFKETCADYKLGILAVTAFDTELNNLQNKLNELKKENFSSIDKSIFEDGNFNEVLYALIKNKFITEKYLDVINHYYGDNSNRIFIQRLFTDSDDLDFKLSLTDIEGLLLQLQENNFTKKQILNFDLIDYLFSEKLREKFNLMVKTAGNLNAGFLEEFINQKKDKKIYEKITKIVPEVHFDLTKLSSDYFEIVINNNQYDDTRSNCEILINRLKDNFNQKNYLTLINSHSVYKSLKYEIISALLEPIDFVEITNTDYWLHAIKDNKVKPTTENISQYFELMENEIDADLISFIERNNIEFNDELPEKFYDALRNNEDISDVAYKHIFEHYGYPRYPAEHVTEQNKEKLNILVNLDLIEVDVSLVELAVEKELSLPTRYFDSNLKQKIIDDKINLNRQLLIQIAENLDDRSKLIISRNIEILDFQKVKELLKDFDEGQKFINILDKSASYQNQRFADDEVKKNILQYFIKEKKYLAMN